MALKDPEFAEGRDVETDPEFVEAQLRYASRYLRLGAERRAIAICIGDHQFRRIEPDLMPAQWPSHEILEYDLGDMQWWSHTAELWQQSGERALANESL